MVHSHQKVTSGVSLREVRLFLQKLRTNNQKGEMTQKITAIIIFQCHTNTNIKPDKTEGQQIIRSISIADAVL